MIKTQTPSEIDILSSPHFSINMTMLARSQPDLASDLTNMTATADLSSLGATIETARSGTITLHYRDQGYFHSRYDPHREASAWAAGVDLQGKVLILFGFGLGYHVEHLLRRQDSGRIVVIEPDPLRLLVAMAARNLGQILATGRVQFILGTDSDKLVAQDLATLLLAATYEGGWSFTALPAYRRVFPAEVEALERQLFLRVRSIRVDLATNEFWLGIWIENVINNLAHLEKQPYVNHWFRRYMGMPAVLAAAGPSLTANLPLLADLKGKVPIIAAGSSFNPLLDFGIEPDLIVSIDGGEANYTHFAGREIKAPLAFAPVIHPRILEEYSGPLLPMPMDQGLYNYILECSGNSAEFLPAGPSVANTTLALMAEMGFNPIILVGQDLAFPGDQYHAEGVRGPQWTSDEQRRSYIWVPDVKGGQVQTDGPFYTMLAWFENYLAHRPDLEVINTSHIGARIARTREASLAQVIKEFELMDRKWPENAFVPRPEDTGRMALKGTFADIIKSHLDPAASLAEKGLHLTRRAMQVMGTGSKQERGNKAISAVVECHQEIRQLDVYRKLFQPLLYYRALTLGDPPSGGTALHAWLKESNQFYQSVLAVIEFLKSQKPSGSKPVEEQED